MATSERARTGLFIVGVIAALVVGTWVATNLPRSETTWHIPVNEGSDNETQPSLWVNHDLNAIPGLENTTVEDLPTIEEVENILFNWGVFENGRPPLAGNWTGSFDFVLHMIKYFGLEYHFDENGDLHVDTPGWVYETPSERKDNEYMIGNFVMENGGIDSRNALDFTRHLSKSGIYGSITIFEIQNAYPQAKTVVPVKEGLAYFDCPGPREKGTTNIKPGETYP